MAPTATRHDRLDMSAARGTTAVAVAARARTADTDATAASARSAAPWSPHYHSTAIAAWPQLLQPPTQPLVPQSLRYLSDKRSKSTQASLTHYSTVARHGSVIDDNSRLKDRLSAVCSFRLRLGESRVNGTGYRYAGSCAWMSFSERSRRLSVFRLRQACATPESTHPTGVTTYVALRSDAHVPAAQGARGQYTRARSPVDVV